MRGLALLKTSALNRYVQWVNYYRRFQIGATPLIV
jgi:hypothetical protein